MEILTLQRAKSGMFITCISDCVIGIGAESHIHINDVYYISYVGYDSIDFNAEYTRDYKDKLRKESGVITTANTQKFRKAYKNEEKLCRR